MDTYMCQTSIYLSIYTYRCCRPFPRLRRRLVRRPLVVLGVVLHPQVKGPQERVPRGGREVQAGLALCVFLVLCLCMWYG